MNLGIAVSLVIGANLLPPDTSLAEVTKRGTLRACVPTTHGPLVTADAEQPGLEIELLEQIADGMGLRLVLQRNQSIGRDFNPRNWRITRAQCEVIAGGIVATETNLSFLESTRPYAETGWALALTNYHGSLADAAIGLLAGSGGLDRIAMSQYLRDIGTSATLVRDDSELHDGLESGAFDVVIGESFTVRQIADDLGGTAMWLPDSLERYPVVFGLWKGDLTLKRVVDAELGELEQQGTVADLLDDYVAGIEERCTICP